MNAKADAKQAAVTVFTTARNEPCGKRLSLDADGKLIKKSLAHALNNAVQSAVTVAHAQGLADLLDGLKPAQALSFGVSNSEFENIVTRKAKEGGAVGGTRTRQNFAWTDGPGVLMLDYDPAPGTVALSKADLLAELYSISPETEVAWHVWRPSAGSCIFDGDGDEIRGITGQRIYLLVRDAADIPRAGAVLAQKAWAAGHGYYLVSKSGALLERCLFDTSVWQPERLDFCGPSDCTDGLTRKMPATEVMGEGLLDTRATLPDLDQKARAQVSKLKAIEKALLQPEQAEVHESYITERAPKLAELTGVDLEQATRTLRAATESHALLADFVLQHRDGHVTVNDLLNDPEKWQHHGFLDPLEPEYQPTNDRIARAELFGGGQPYLRSFAHGGQRYTLHRQRGTIQLTDGDETGDADTVLQALRTRDALLFQRGVGADAELVAVHGSHIVPQCETRLGDRIGRILKTMKFGGQKRELRPCECSRGIVAKIHKRGGQWDLRDLRGVITAPTMRPDGSLLTMPGYDHATGLLLINPNGADFTVPAGQDKDALRKTLEYLWHPFRLYPLQDETDKGVLLAAIFTAVIRRARCRPHPPFSSARPRPAAVRPCWRPLSAIWLRVKIRTRKHGPRDTTPKKRRRRCSSRRCGTPSACC